MPIAKFCRLAILIIVAGCTTQPAKDRAAHANPGSDVQCHSEELTGSMITRTVCTTKEQRDAQQAVVDKVERTVHQPGDPCRPAAGC